MSFDFKSFVLTLGTTGGVLYLADIFWFAWDGSNIDYNVGWVVGIVIGAIIGSISRTR